MATAEGIKAKLQGLIEAANAATGNADADLTAAVQSLIDGFGQSGGGKSASGTYTPASDTGYMIVKLDFVPNIIEFRLDDFDNKAFDGVTKILTGAYCNGLGYSRRTNTSGSALGSTSVANGIDTLIVENDNTSPTPYIPRPRAAGGFHIYSNFVFRAGYTYSWRCSE